MLGNDKDFLCTRVSYKLDLHGPSMTIQTACSTSLVAVAVACRALIAANAIWLWPAAYPLIFRSAPAICSEEGMIFSPDGHCRPFDADARGTRAGEGAGIVVLKRLAERLADRDTIHAVIRGAAINNDGAGKAGYTAPSVDGQIEVIAMAQALAGVDPRTISYIEAHGTGTPLGDPIEIAALDASLSRVDPRRRLLPSWFAQGQSRTSRCGSRRCRPDQDRPGAQASRNSPAGEFPHAEPATRP